MGQVNGTESGDAYTVVIFRGSSAKPLRFSFPRKLVSRLLVVGAISGSIDDLKKRLASMKEVNQRLRVMLGIEPQKTGDTTNGRGGVDAPIPDGHTLDRK